MRYSFKYGLFSKRVKMFCAGKRGIVVEKEKDVVCIYGTDENYQILCAIPLTNPKFLKGKEFIIEFDEKERASVCVGDIQLVIDYSRKKCASNKPLKFYGSELWGEDVKIEMEELKNTFTHQQGQYN